MSVTKRNNSKNYYIQFMFNGKQYVKSAKTTNKRLAENIERKWRDELITQSTLNELQTITIEEALTTYLDSQADSKSHRDHKSHCSKLLGSKFDPYKKITISCKPLLSKDTDIHNIQSHHIERLVVARKKEGNSEATIKKEISFLRCAITYAKRLGYKVNPDLEYPSGLKTSKQRLRFLTLDEEKRLLDELNPRRNISGIAPYEKRTPEMKRMMQDNCDLVCLLLDTGARVNEIAQINWSQINLLNRKISLWRSKTSNESVLDMTDRVYRILSRRFDEKINNDWVFTNRKGNAPRRYAKGAVDKALKRAGLADVTYHVFRHTFASRLLQNGMSLLEVKDLLGHADIQTTMIYSHLEQSKTSSKAVNILSRLCEEVGMVA